MQNHKSIRKVVELLEMIEFILLSNKPDKVGAKRARGNDDKYSAQIPLSGIAHSITDSIELLSEFLDSEFLDSEFLDSSSSGLQNDTSRNHPYDKTISKVRLEEDRLDEIKVPPGENRERIKKPARQGASSGLAGRIRPVPEEVRGRVRELVDMIENEEFPGK